MYFKHIRSYIVFEFHPKSLARSIPNGGELVYDNGTFRYVLLEHLPMISKRSDISYKDIDQSEADQFYGDFYGLLTYLGVPLYLHWFTMRLNGLSDSMDYDSNFLTIYLPPPDEIDRIRIIFLTEHG